MATLTGNVDLPDEAAKFSREFEEYRRACRERYQQQQKPAQVVEEDECPSVETDDGAEDFNDEAFCETITSCGLKELRHSTSPSAPSEALHSGAATTTCTNTTQYSAASAPLDSSTEALRSSASGERRNSFNKVMSFCSNIFKKSDSPKPSTAAKLKEKQKTKAERDKEEQDWRMARFIAELEFEGRSDEEIQMHLFHIRDQAQLARPRTNSLGEWFRDMHQAFKDELSSRKCVTVHVSTVNPFAAAAPANYVHDVGYSYEDLVALEPVPRGLKSCDHLPTLVYEGQELPANQITCAVCMHDFEVSEDLRSLNCSHHFHTECIDKWLGVATTCPVCKCDVNRE